MERERERSLERYNQTRPSFSVLRIKVMPRERTAVDEK
jgi:hypothetical protein